MMREIKFELYDFVEKKMGKIISLGFEGWPTLVEFEDGSRETYFGEIPYVRRQYVGKKDANDIEIYEGDIVEWENPDLFGEPENGVTRIGNKVRSVIEYDDEEGCFKPLYWYDCNLENDDIRVIGNIYQNSELLEEE